jgi:hypothetical protein
MGHLPPSYEDRCLRTWFAAPDVQNSRDNPMHFCSHSSAHLPDCACKCGAIEGAAVTGTPRIEARHESDGRGSNGNEYLRMGQSSSIVESAPGANARRSAGSALFPSVRT